MRAPTRLLHPPAQTILHHQTQQKRCDRITWIPVHTFSYLVVLFVRINESCITLEVVNTAPQRHDTHEANRNPGGDIAAPDDRFENHNEDCNNLRYRLDLASHRIEPIGALV